MNINCSYSGTCGGSDSCKLYYKGSDQKDVSAFG